MNKFDQYDERQRRASTVLCGIGTALVLLIANIPGWNEGFNRNAANALAVVGLLSLLLVWKFPWHHYNRNLFSAMALSTTVLLVLLQYYTGGAASPFNAFFLLIVLFSAVYYSRGLALLIGLVVSVASLAPLLYSDPSTARNLRLVVTAVAYLATVHVGSIMVAELVHRERARRGLAADLEEVRRLRDDLARANQMERRRTRQLQAVHDIGREVMSILDPATLYWTLVHTLQARLSYNIVTIFVRDRPSEDLVLAAHVGLNLSREAVDLGQCRLAPGKGIVGHVAQTRRPFVTGNVASVRSMRIWTLHSFAPSSRFPYR